MLALSLQMVKDRLLALVGGEPKLMNLIIGGLRRAWFRSPSRLSVLYNVRSEEETVNKDGSIGKRKAVWFSCQICNTKCKGQRSSLHPYIQIDHIDPIIPVDSQLKSWDELIQRIFVDVSGLQAICNTCHNKKTQEENALRRAYRKAHK